jgi:hypothetical protein
VILLITAWARRQPARFVSCYAYGLVPSDFHAVFESYLDQRWWLFDATRQAHLDGLVRIRIGRDAAEVASTPFGTVEPKALDIRIDPSGTNPDQGPRPGKPAGVFFCAAKNPPLSGGGFQNLATVI